MKIKRKLLTGLLIFLILFTNFPVTKVSAATTPNLGQASSFSILSSTYTNTVGGTTLSGDLGYTTGPAFAPTVNGTTYSPPSSKYSSAGTDQGAALVNLNNQPCTHTFPAGAVNLATDTSHGTIGVYAPGVYCTTAASAASIGTGGITLTGSGTYIFRMDGALTTVANSTVSLANGAQGCDVFWTPTAATTLGANSTFVGTDISNAGITIGSTVLWAGRALAFGGTVSTTTDTLSTPTCSTSTTSSSDTSSGSSSGGGRTCPPLTFIAPIIIEARRIDADSIFISWGPYSGIDTFNVRYGLTNGAWLYSTNVTGFSTTINDLPPNQPIWVQIAANDNCSIGTYGEARLVGGPLLPNTGLAPEKKSILDQISAVISVFSSFFQDRVHING